MITKVRCDVLRNQRLSWAAKGVYGVYCYLQEVERIDRPSLGDVMAYGGAIEPVVAAAFSELELAGVLSPIKRPSAGVGRTGEGLKSKSKAI